MMIHLHFTKTEMVPRRQISYQTIRLSHKRYTFRIAATLSGRLRVRLFYLNILDKYSRS